MTDLICKRCNETSPETNFKPDVRYKRGFSSWCHACHRESNREWYLSNKEKQGKKSRLWRKENLEAARRISRKHHRGNAAERGKQHAEWARRNKGKRRATAAKRKAAQLQATPMWADMEKVQAIYKNAAAIQAYTGTPYHVDHIVPLQGENVCGLHWEGNLQIITATENMRKHNKWDASIEDAYKQGDMFVEAPTPKPLQEGMDL